MGEVLPNAIPLMAKAAQDAGLSLSGTVKEMMELQQRGELVSTKVLPHFAKRMRDAAQDNGGLDKAINSNRVAMNRLVLTMQMSADAFFKSGFADGLTDFFNSTASFIKDTIPLWSALGRVIGGTLKVISRFIDLISPFVKAVGRVLDELTSALGDFSAVIGVGLGIAAVARYIGILGSLRAALFGVAEATNAATAATVASNAASASASTGLLGKIPPWVKGIGKALVLPAIIGAIGADLAETKVRRLSQQVSPNPSLRRRQASVVNEITLQPAEVKVQIGQEEVAKAVTNSATYHAATEGLIRDRMG